VIVLFVGMGMAFKLLPQGFDQKFKKCRQEAGEVTTKPFPCQRYGKIIRWLLHWAKIQDNRVQQVGFQGKLTNRGCQLILPCEKFSSNSTSQASEPG